MTMTLVLDTRTAMGHARKASDAAAIAAIALEGYAPLDDDDVDRIAMLLDGTQLSNGESVAVFSYDEDDDDQTIVCAFGPALLTTQDQDYVRDRLTHGVAGRQACRLFEEAIRRRLKVRLCGSDTGFGAHIALVQIPDDEVEINRGDAAMAQMMVELAVDQEIIAVGVSTEIAFDAFSRAVHANAHRCGPYAQPLRQFVGSGHRQGSTHVTWG